MWMTFNHLNTNSTKLAHYRLKIRKVIEFFYFQSLMQHPLSVKFINQGVGSAAALFSSRRLKNWKTKQFSSAWKLLKLTRDVNFWSERTILNVKILFLRLNPFSRDKYPNSITRSLRERVIFMMLYLLN